MMISFNVGDSMKFNLRSAGLVVLGDRILFQRFADRDWWFLPGGRVEMMEDSGMAVMREVMEEYGWTVKEKTLKLLVENFFELDGRDFHEIGMYYAVELEEAPELATGEFVSVEENLVSKWIKFDELERHNIVPNFLANPEMLDEILGSDTVKHLIFRG